jgi:protein involved in polysaccharide export with SLBB domain
MRKMNFSGKLFGRGASGFGVLLAAVLLAGCVTDGPYPPTVDAGPFSSQNGTGDTSLILRPGEMVKIEFSGLPHLLPPHEEQIKEDGALTLPLIGRVEAGGKTPGQLQGEIHEAYVPRFYRNLNVVVRAADRFYTVGGEVKTPSRQVYLGPTTVIKAIKSAGDFTDFARKTRVRISRADGRTETINAVRAIDDPRLDVPIFPGDIIHVPRRILFE